LCAAGLPRSSLKAIKYEDVLYDRCAVEALNLSSDMSSLVEESSAKRPVNVEMLVQKVTGSGYWVRGTAAAPLVLQCLCCGRGFEGPVEGPFEVWLNPSPTFEDAPDANELPFPSNLKVADLSTYVVDALALAAPIEPVCDSPACVTAKAEGRMGANLVWSSSDSGSNAGRPAIVLPIAAARKAS